MQSLPVVILLDELCDVRSHAPKLGTMIDTSYLETALEAMLFAARGWHVLHINLDDSCDAADHKHRAIRHQGGDVPESPPGHHRADRSSCSGLGIVEFRAPMREGRLGVTGEEHLPAGQQGRYVGRARGVHGRSAGPQVCL